MENHTELFNLSKNIIPGGVHSPVRSFKGLHREPIFIEKGDGAYLYDIDGNEYIDFCMSFGPLILGHNDRDVARELKLAIDRGWSFGACEPYSLKLAQFLVNNIPFIDQIRFVNSGTEAVMTALRLARGYTNRSKIIKFNGCYHGHTDSMLIKAGSGLAGTAEASSCGVPEGISNDTLIFELGTREELVNYFEQNGKDVAAIIIEPLPANNGLLPQAKEYLEFLRNLTEKHGSLLIFDEVISGFRVGFEGMSGKMNITPDLVTYGKIIGGGLPVGAVAGSEKIMSNLAPVGNVYQAGTLSANPLAMIGGLTTLSKLTPEVYEQIKKNTTKITKLFERWLKEYDDGIYSHYQVVSESSLFWLIPGNKIDKVCDIPSDLGEKFKPLFKTLLDKGIYLSPNAYEVGFISLAHNNEVISQLEKRLFD
jgi:glutamate-1-semialdehyde 2,1-aminomutase